MNAPDPDPQSVLVLQGGGALGAYQAGVYEALATRDIAPDWVAGISIGAINAALIAGNAPQDRIPALKKFWHGISRELQYRLDEPIGFARRAFNEASAQYAATMGLPGFFTPRWPMPLPVRCATRRPPQRWKRRARFRWATRRRSLASRSAPNAIAGRR